MLRCGSGLAFLICVEPYRTFQKLLSCGKILESHCFCLLLSTVVVNSKVSQSLPDCYPVMLCQLLLYPRTKGNKFLYFIFSLCPGQGMPLFPNFDECTLYNVPKFQHDNPSHPHAPSDSLTLFDTQPKHLVKRKYCNTIQH